MSTRKQKSAFISYRIYEHKETDLAYNLYNFLKNDVDTFLDTEELRNDVPLLSNCVHEAGSRHNYILLLSEHLIDELIECHQHGNHGREAIDYVYEELRAAIRSHNIIIPVFFEDGLTESVIAQRERELFVECFELQDSYRHVAKDPNESHKQLFERILTMIGFREPIQHVDFSGVYWVGIRESDMPDIEGMYGFKGGVFLFGETSTAERRIMCEKSMCQRVDHNDSDDTTQDDFIRKSITEILQNDPNAKFMFYNPSTVYRLQLAQEYGSEHFICLNAKEILDIANNKRSFRALVKDIVPLLPVIERTRTDCDYDDLLQAKEQGEFEDLNDYQEYYRDCDGDIPDIEYDEHLRFIVQAPIASGGSGTFILTKDNAKYLLAALDKTATYLVSVYHTHNVPVNMHVIIYDDDIIFTPASIQIEREVDVENKLLYKGADFIAYGQLPYHLRKQFEKQVQKVAKRLQEQGYRGICGIDGIIHDGRVNILEVNGRFQASTELINRALLSQNAHTLQELNYMAFYPAERNWCISSGLYSCLRVPYSNYTLSYEGNSQHDIWIHTQAEKLLNGYRQATEPITLKLQNDGYHRKQDMRFCAQAYLYRLSFRSNIVSVSEDCSVFLNENLCGPDKWLKAKILSRDKLAVKLALMIQGINISKEIRSELREATNNAIDLQFGDDKDVMIVNAPTNIRYVEFSPFSLIHSSESEGKFCILYYGAPLLDGVGVFPTDQNQSLMLEDGNHSYSEIAYLSTDRLRIHLTNKCCFKSDKGPKTNKGCQFCNIAINHNPYPIAEKDISEVVKRYISDKQIAERDPNNHAVKLRHFLIGGQSLSDGDEMLVAAARAISEQNRFWRMPIYVMTLPLSDETVEKLVKYGVYEYAYNIEIFNEKCRKKYMPGKSSISVDNYISALVRTRRILNSVDVHESKKAIRSMVIVGLEPYRDMMEGIRLLIDNGIEPLLSVFRPLPDTPLSDRNAPPIRQVYELFYEVSDALYHQNPTQFRKLGPQCTCCQNNTVSLPWRMLAAVTRPTWTVDSDQANFKEKMS